MSSTLGPAVNTTFMQALQLIAVELDEQFFHASCQVLRCQLFVRLLSCNGAGQAMRHVVQRGFERRLIAATHYDALVCCGYQ